MQPLKTLETLTKAKEELEFKRHTDSVLSTEGPEETNKKKV